MKRVYAFLPVTAMFVILAGCNAGTTTKSGEPAGGEVAIPADGIELNFVANEGDSWSYLATMTMEGSGPATPGVPGDIEVTAEVKQTITITKVDGNNYTTETTFSDVEVTGTEMVANAIKAGFDSMKPVVTMDNKGRVIEQTGSMDSSGMGGGSVYYPDNKVKIGDEWTQSTPTPGGNMEATFKLEAVETVDGIETARILMTPTTADNMSSGEITYWVDISNGQVMRTDG